MPSSAKDTTRLLSSAACAVEVVVTPDEIISVHWWNAASTDVPILIFTAAVAVPDPVDSTVLNVVVPHPSGTGLGRLFRLKFASCTAKVSSGAIGTFNANVNVTTVGAAVTGFENVRRLTTIAGVTPCTAEDLTIGVAEICVLCVNCTAAVRSCWLSD